MQDTYRRYLAGDDDALAEIITACRPALTRFLYRYLQNESAAEELAIDVFAELVFRPGRYNFKTSLKTYLFMLGRSRAIDLLRRRRQTLPLAEVADRPAEEPLPEALLLAEERRRALYAALADLPREMGEALYLVYIEELSYEEAAAILKKSRKQIDNLLYRGKAILKEKEELKL